MLRLQSDILGREAKKVEKHCLRPLSPFYKGDHSQRLLYNVRAVWAVRPLSAEEGTRPRPQGQSRSKPKVVLR